MKQTPPPVAALQELGLNLTEARIYLALLQESPANGHQISRNAGVPSAKVYENLARMKQGGLVAATSQGNAYVPLALEDFLEAREARLRQAGDVLRESVPKRSAIEGEVLWQSQGYQPLISRARRMVKDAHASILASAWPDEIEALLPELEAARNRGVDVSAIAYASPERCRTLATRFASSEHLHLFPHALLPSIHERHGGQASVVVDETNALLMDASRESRWQGVWTANPAVVRTTANYIRHDIYINRLYFDLTTDLSDRYGATLAGLLDVRKGGIVHDPIPNATPR